MCHHICVYCGFLTSVITVWLQVWPSDAVVKLTTLCPATTVSQKLPDPDLLQVWGCPWTPDNCLLRSLHLKQYSHHLSSSMAFCWHFESSSSTSLPPSQIYCTSISCCTTWHQWLRFYNGCCQWPHSTFPPGCEIREDVRGWFWWNGEKLWLWNIFFVPKGQDHGDISFSFFTETLTTTATLAKTHLWRSHGRSFIFWWEAMTFKEIVWHFGKYAYSLCCWELVERELCHFYLIVNTVYM